MKSKLLLVTLLTASNIYALTIEEAVNSALEKSYQLHAKESTIYASQASEDVLTGAYKPNLSLGYQFTSRDFENFMRKKKESLFNLSLDYNLFNGFYDKYTLKSQEKRTLSERYLKASLKADIKQETQYAYLSLLQALKVQKVQNEAVQLLSNQLKDSHNFFKQGLIAKSKYLKVKVALQSTKQDKLHADSDVVNIKNRLSSLTHEDVELSSLQESNVTLNHKPHFATDMNHSIHTRSEIGYLKALIESQKASKQAVNSVYYPKIGLALDYNKYGDEFIPDNFSYGALGSIDDEWMGTVSLSYELYSGGRAKNQKLIHKHTIMSLEQDILRTKADIKLQLQQAIEYMKVSKGQVAVAKLSISEAKEHYRMTQNRFKQQLDSTTDLLDARLLLTKAENALYQAKYDYQKAIVDYERVLEK